MGAGSDELCPETSNHASTTIVNKDCLGGIKFRRRSCDKKGLTIVNGPLVAQSGRAKGLFTEKGQFR